MVSPSIAVWGTHLEILMSYSRICIQELFFIGQRDSIWVGHLLYMWPTWVWSCKSYMFFLEQGTRSNPWVLPERAPRTETKNELLLVVFRGPFGMPRIKLVKCMKNKCPTCCPSAPVLLIVFLTFTLNLLVVIPYWKINLYGISVKSTLKFLPKKTVNSKKKKSFRMQHKQN